MVIFTEKKFINYMREHRIDSYETTVIPTELTDLKMYQYLDVIKEIQSRPEYMSSHPSPIAPEICEPLYNVVTCSKMNLVYQATRSFPQYDYFIWMDIGYTHGSIDLSAMPVYYPSSIFKQRDRLACIAVGNIEAAARDPIQFFRQYVDILIGGFFGGYRSTIETVTKLYYDLVLEMFSLGIKDDDQFYNTILAQRYPGLFYIMYTNNWYHGVYIK